MLDLVADTVIEGRLQGARRVLCVSMEERFGPLDEIFSLALELADAFTLNECFRRSKTASTVRQALAPALQSIGLADAQGKT